MSSGCGCKYRFPHITYPYSSCIIMLFLQQHPYFFYVFRSCTFQHIFVINLIIFSRSINKHKGDYGRPTEAV